MPRKPVGFGEEQQPELRSGGSAGTPDVTHFKLKVGPGGRVVIPAEVRRGLGVKEGGVRFWDYLGCRLGVPGATVVASLPALIRAVPSRSPGGFDPPLARPVASAPGVLPLLPLFLAQR